MKAIGAKRWAIAEGYIPGKSTGSGRELTSHETVCVLNMGDTDARVEIAVYFSDREPAGPFTFTVPARRTQHIRFNDFCDPEKIPVNTDFASVITSDVPAHTRIGRNQFDAKNPKSRSGLNSDASRRDANGHARRLHLRRP
jgi:hypothetical protein